MILLLALLLPNNLMPVPAKIAEEPGRLAIDETFRVAFRGYREPRLEAAGVRLVRRLAMKTGIPLSEESAATGPLQIECGHAGDDESYSLIVDNTHAVLRAPAPPGVLHGMETFLQLVEQDAAGFGAPAVRIEDAPRFPWRGLLLDVARHWMPMEVVKRTLDGMAAVKLNVFHWHLSDDQGFRIESKVFPELQGRGSDGHYFTQQQAREVIAYARERGIRVVPEFDMPGHTTAWFVGHPELASAPGPYQIERTWGIFDPCMDPTREEVYAFLDRFIGEMAALFPDPYFHIGGDEVNGKQWNTSARVQKFKQEHGMKDNRELQAYFTRRLQAIVTRHGKRMIGWDEILDPSLPKDVVIQSWRGAKSLAEAAQQGFAGILSFGYYLDHMRSAAYHYGIDPAGMGGEACMWSEMVTPENVDGRIWPRLAAIAERLWSPQNVTDVADMYRRSEAVSRELDRLGLKHRLNYQLMLERLAGTHAPEPVRVLAEIVEPVKGYERGTARKYTSFTPLNRLVDTTRPEALVQVDRAHLMLWRDNHKKLAPIIADSALLKEVEPISEDASALAQAGLEALDYSEAGKHAPPEWVERQKALLRRASQHRAELLLMIVAPVQKLIESAR